MTKSSEKKWLKKIRFLSQTLIISGAINISLFVIFFYFILKDNQQHISFDHKPLKTVEEEELNNSKYLSYFSSLSFRELVSYLSNKQRMEEGYTKRDLALGCLVTFHHFYVEKAVSFYPLQKRSVIFLKDGSKKCNVTLFPNLSDYHFESIIHYAYTEKWPLTSKGLFSLLHQWKKPRAKSLEEAVYVTPEFHTVNTLFHQGDISLRPQIIIELFSEISWELIDTFVYEQSKVQDLSIERRRNFLLLCLEERSPIAAFLLLQTDFIYAARRLDDASVLTLLELLKEENSEDVEQFCFELLKSSRSDDVWKMSAKKLYEIAGENSPDPYDHEKALNRFVHSQQLQEKWQKDQSFPLRSIIGKKEEAKKGVHLVKEGDNLWKIARIHKVDIDALIKINHLETDCIFPGMEIQLPQED